MNGTRQQPQPTPPSSPPSLSPPAKTLTLQTLQQMSLCSVLSDMSISQAAKGTHPSCQHLAGPGVYSHRLCHWWCCGQPPAKSKHPVAEAAPQSLGRRWGGFPGPARPTPTLTASQEYEAIRGALMPQVQRCEAWPWGPGRCGSRLHTQQPATTTQLLANASDLTARLSSDSSAGRLPPGGCRSPDALPNRGPNPALLSLQSRQSLALSSNPPPCRNWPCKARGWRDSNPRPTV